MSILDLHAAGDGDNRYYTGVGARITPSGYKLPNIVLFSKRNYSSKKYEHD